MNRSALRRSSRLALLVLSLLVVASCGRSGPAIAVPKPRPGIVLIVVDTLRADAVPLEERSATRMPALREFAKGATAFADAIAPGAWTPQSIPSILTGLVPPHTGCQGMAETNVPPLPGAVETLAERLHAAGYSTFAYTGGGQVSATLGHAQGFDTFQASFDVLGPEACLAGWSRERPPAAPFFLMLHTYAPHDPYGEKDARAMASVIHSTTPPSRALLRAVTLLAQAPDIQLDPVLVRDCGLEWFLDGPARPANSRLILSKEGRPLVRSLQHWQDGGYLADPAGREAIEERFRTGYQRGLELTDRLLARTFAALESASLPADTIVVVTSDHGEAFGEHGYLTHERRLHDEIVRVPLVVRAPGRLPQGVVIRGTCGPVDLAPTLLELAGLSVDADELDGQSLVGMSHGREAGHPVVSTADRYETKTGRLRAAREVTVRDVRRTWCYVYDVENGEVLSEHLFDRVADPLSLVPLAMSAVEWEDAEFCALVAARRDSVRRRFALPPLGSPCEIAR